MKNHLQVFHDAVLNDPCLLRASDHMLDWFVIVPYAGNGQPEGTAAEWLAILAAMRAEKPEIFDRCAVTFDREGNAWFESPRNSRSVEAAVKSEELDKWIVAASAALEKRIYEMESD